MRISETDIPGLLLLETEVLRDERGYFARIFDEAELTARGIAFATRQSSLSFNARRGTLRGLHYQIAPAAETKLVRCLRGAVFDVAVDLRPQSGTFTRWHGCELSGDNMHALLIPPGCAHGFVTLADKSELLYQIDTPYAPELARGVRWNDPAFAIAWPLQPAVIAPRDAAYPDFAP
jgi:dTDP-4-dehydrorhamnose 3,5-epimerase